MTAPAAPTPATRRQAQVTWQQSLADLRSARRKLRQRALLDAGYLSLQTAVNALATVCRLQGLFQIPHHSLSDLIGLCCEADPRFEALRDVPAVLDEVLLKSPFAPAEDPLAEAPHAEACLREAGRVVELVRGYLKENRRRYFAP